MDNLHNSAGDVALSLNNGECYTLIRDAGIRSEMLLTLLSKRDVQVDSPFSLVLKATDNTAAGSTDTFLSSKLRYTTDDNGQDICMLTLEDGEEIGVMMGWERGISESFHRNYSAYSHLNNSSHKCKTLFADSAMTTLTQNVDSRSSTSVLV